LDLSPRSKGLPSQRDTLLFGNGLAEFLKGDLYLRGSLLAMCPFLRGGRDLQQRRDVLLRIVVKDGTLGKGKLETKDQEITWLPLN